MHDLAVFYGDFKAVREVDLDIRANEITAFIGPSGCGKTTFLRCLNRMNDTVAGARVEGTIRYHGVDLYGPEISATQVRRHVGMVFQKPNPFPKSIYDNVATPAPGRDHCARTPTASSNVRCDRLRCGRGVEPSEDLGARTVGRPAAAVVHRPSVAVEPDVILMDEPCWRSTRSPARIEDLMTRSGSLTIVIVTHNMQQAARVSDHVRSSPPSLNPEAIAGPGGSSSSMPPVRSSPTRVTSAPRRT